MKPSYFENIARNHGFKPLDPVSLKEGDLLVAERFFDFGDMEFSPAVREKVFEFMIPHWCVLWALHRDELDVGQYVYHGRDTAAAERIDLAKKAADDWVSANLEGQRF